MKIALIGASGFVGTAILREALDRGHEVTAIARNTGKITVKHDALKTIDADVLNVNEIAAAVKGNDVVISAYNAGWTNPDLYNEFTKGSKTIQQGVKDAGVKRLIVIGGAGSLEIAPGVQIVDTPQFPADIKPGALAARDYHNYLKDEEQLDWTFFSPAMEMHQGTSGIRRGTYRKGLDNPVFDENGVNRLSVEDLAMVIIDEVEKPVHIKQRFTAAY